MNLGAPELLILATTLIPLVLVAIALTGNRPRADRFCRINALPERPADVAVVHAVLRRTWVSRVAGGATGLTLGVVSGIKIGGAFAIGGAGVGLLVGTMLGIAVATRTPRAASDLRHASLAVRNPSDYRPRSAIRVTVGLAVIVIGYATFAILTAPGSLGVTVVIFGLAFATVLAVPLGGYLQRRTVEVGRGEIDDPGIRVDDALRAASVRGIHYATVGVLLCGLLLAGYGTALTQGVTTVRVGDRTVAHLPPASEHTTITPNLSADPTVWYIAWTEPGGVTKSRRIASTETVAFGTLAAGPLLAIGFWTSVVGLIGALVAWSMSAKAWKHPQRVPELAAA